jgi:hypothetical protein
LYAPQAKSLLNYAGGSGPTLACALSLKGREHGRDAATSHGKRLPFARPFIQGDAEILMHPDFRKSGQRGDTHRSRDQGREEIHGSKESRGYKHRLKNALASYLKNLREHLHDVHRPG